MVPEAFTSSIQYRSVHPPFIAEFTLNSALLEQRQHQTVMTHKLCPPGKCSARPNPYRSRFAFLWGVIEVFKHCIRRVGPIESIVKFVTMKLLLELQ